MIYIFDFEDGLQPVLSHFLGLPDVKHMYWDRKGFFSEINEFAEKNIIILSKPYDCLQRGVQRGKYKDSNIRDLKDWSRRNWRYSNPEIYEHINGIISKMESKLIIHPDDLLNGTLRSKIKDYLNVDLSISKLKMKDIYEGHTNIK